MPTERATLSIDAWKALAAKGEAPTDARLIKAFAGVVERAEGDPATAPLRIRISTTQRDRDRDTISAAGWKLDNFRKNPVVLFAHNSRALPIGRDEGLAIEADAIVGTPRFCDGDMNPLGPMVERMLRAGFLNAASVGFLPLKWQINEEERGYDFIEQELLEYSIVPVPANPGALVQARAAGIELVPLKGWLEQLLDEWPADESPVVIPRAVAERALKIAAGDPATSSVPADVGARFERIESQLAELAVLRAATPPEQRTAAGTKDEDIVFELVEEAAPESETFDVDPDELRAWVGEAVGPAVGSVLTALTGRLD